MKSSGSIYRIVAVSISILALCYFAGSLAGKWGGVIDSLRLFMSWGWLLACEFALMTAGLFLETLRWSFIRKVFANGDMSDDFIATLRAVALGNSTPANVGEHVGRGMSYNSKRLATEASLCSSVIQTFTIVVIGSIGGIYIAHETGRLDFQIVKVVFAVILIIGGVFYYWVRHSRWSQEIQTAIRSEGAMSNFAVAALINAVKFCLFSFQFALLLSIGCKLTMLLFCHVLFYYVCVTFIPRLNIIDIGVKGALSIYVFSAFCPDEIIISSTLLLWGINIIIPSVAGYIAIFLNRKAQ